MTLDEKEQQDDLIDTMIYGIPGKWLIIYKNSILLDIITDRYPGSNEILRCHIFI